MFYRILSTILFVLILTQPSIATSPCTTDCPMIDMISIGSGQFYMGRNDLFFDQKPERLIQVQASFLASMNEITVAQYRSCVDAGVCSTTGLTQYLGCHWSNQPSTKENYPINCVNWFQARTFAQWLNMDLPTEAQWEYMALSQSQTSTYPWENTFFDICEFANLGISCHSSPTSVCQYSIGNSQQGLCDLIGNVWEWVLDEYQDSYHQHSAYEKPVCDDLLCENHPQALRVYRGGSFYSNANVINSKLRNKNHPDARSPNLGFRIVNHQNQCGDGVVQIMEECDDGNSNQQDGCDNTCKSYMPCGNNCPSIPMVSLSNGSFYMGSNDLNEQPKHLVNMSDFQMSKSEITVGQYRNCVSFGPCTAPVYTAHDACTWTENIGNQEDYPINCLNWQQARDFAKWVGADLPSEAQWEYAAKNQGQDILYPWGNEEPSCLFSNFNNINELSCQQGTLPVCYFDGDLYRIHSRVGVLVDNLGGDSSFRSTPLTFIVKQNDNSNIEVSVRETTSDDDLISPNVLNTNGFGIDPITSQQTKIGSAIAKAKAINDSFAITGVRAVVRETRTDDPYHLLTGNLLSNPILDSNGELLLGNTNAILAVTLDNNNIMIVNGLMLDDLIIEDQDASHSLRNAINVHTLQTGVNAEVNEYGELVLIAKDGRNIMINYKDGSGAYNADLASKIGLKSSTDPLLSIENLFVYSGKITLISQKPIEIKGSNNSASYDISECLGNLIDQYDFNGDSILADASISIVFDQIDQQPTNLTSQGICDLADNVSEWTLDSYQSSYVNAPNNGSPWCTDASCNDLFDKVIRGGNWTHGKERFLNTSRGPDSPEIAYINLGFRIVRQ